MGAISSDRGLIVPTYFGDVGIWGPELVTTLTALDSILGGSLTLYSSNGMSALLSSSQAQMQRIVVQGALSTPFYLGFASSNFALGNYQVWNNASIGGSPIICQTLGGGATCQVPFGSMRLVNVDGINAQLADVQNLSGASSGYLNKFRNGTFAIAQRGTSGELDFSVSSQSQISLDGWYVSGVVSGGPPIGARIPWSQVYNSNFNGYGISLNGSSHTPGSLSITSSLFQRIEGSVAAQLLGSSISSPSAVTVQFIIYNNTGASITPTLTTSFATALDNWSASTTDVGPVNMQVCPNGVVTVVSYTFTPSASASNGYQISISPGVIPNSNSANVVVGIADIRVTPGLPVGLNNSPPVPEQRSIHDELEFCQRYFFVPPSGWGYLVHTNMFSTGSVVMSAMTQFPVTMRAVPAASNLTFHTSGISGVSQPAQAQTTDGWGFVPTISTGINTGVFYVTGGQFSAEL